MGCLRAIARFARKVFDRLESLLEEVSDDPLVQRAFEADLGLPPGALDKAKAPRPELTGIDEYINDVDASAEKIKLTVEAIQAYAKFWTSVFEAAQQDDPTLVLDELVYRLFQMATVDLMKYDHPTGYAVMRLLGAIKQDVLVSVEDSFVPQLPANMFSGDYWRAFPDEFARAYLNFRLDQADVLVPGDDLPSLPPDEQIRRDQLGFRVFGLSDAVFVPVFILLMWKRKALERALGVTIDHVYGWELPPRLQPPPCGELPPGEHVPLADHIASRAHTLRIAGPAGPEEDASATLTQLLLVDEEGRLGWLLSLRGAAVFEKQGGTTQRPLEIKLKVEAHDGLDAVVKFSGDDKFVFAGAPTAGLELTVEPAETSVRAPAISIPEATGTRLEIGDFSFKAALSNDGFNARAEAKKSALVLVSGEADSFTEQALPAKETRVEFDLALVFDHVNGFYVDGGSRLATTISVNKSLGPIKIQSIQLALSPSGTDSGSELGLTATTSFVFKLGPIQISVEQIGLTFDVGSSSEPAPEDSLELLGPLLYLGNLGFRAPSGVGILVDCGPVTGGGFLFFDRENEQYAGVLQLEICEWLSLKAIGLITTRMPDGSKGFSLLVILSVEFNPPIQLGLGFTLGGAGGLLGIHRTLDADALRAGLRNHALDAVLFPKDPVANAGQLINSLRSIFPPARGRHLFGLSVILGFGTPALITAEVMVILEWGVNSRLAILGQLHLAFPKSPKKFLEMHVDGAGIWDFDQGTFSLDARLYDSRIAFITFHGDVALRHSSRDDAAFLFSAGGYHPEFAAPATFPQLERLKISLADSENLRLLLTGYIAITSNTRQIGAEMEFFAGFGGFTIECRIGFDVLWEPDVRFIVDFDLEAKIKYKGMTLLGVDVFGRFTGPEPKRCQGEWSIDLWLFSISKSFDRTHGPDRPPAELPGVDPLPELVAALRDARSWNAELPPSARTLVTLRSQVGGGEVLVHPLGDLSVRQGVLPLGIQIDRFAGGVPTGERSFSITQVSIGGKPMSEFRPVTELFAPAAFIELSDDEKIARPSFEAMPAGISLQLQGLTFGGQDAATANQAAASELDFDDRIVGADGAVNGGGRGVLSGVVAAAAADFGPAARSPLRATGMSRFRAPGPAFRVRAEGFVVAGVDDLAPVDGAAPAGGSFTAVQQALERHLEANPRARGTLQVVPVFATEQAP